MKHFSEFEGKIGVSFADKNLLKQAFTHRSFLNEHPGEDIQHNERLEFLGDAVLELVSTEYLYATFPNKPEGELTAYRAALVNTVSISSVAKTLEMDNYLLLSKGEARDVGKARQFILANTYEAFIGALYLDQGYEAARTFITTTLLYRLKTILEERSWQDAKSHFQEEAQEKTGVTPSYSVLKEEGPDHAKIFTVGVYLGDEEVAVGQGQSKQEAEQGAAAEALKRKGWGQQ
ncbi:MAG: ribonuclease III [Parcubacteria group bacterium]|nr:ribonuclease III [Parcubacteria group bacterium]